MPDLGSRALLGVGGLMLLRRRAAADCAPADVSGHGVEWHVSFTDPRPFVAYRGPLFAQA